MFERADKTCGCVHTHMQGYAAVILSIACPSAGGFLVPGHPKG